MLSKNDALLKAVQMLLTIHKKELNKHYKDEYETVVGVLQDDPETLGRLYLKVLKEKED